VLTHGIDQAGADFPPSDDEEEDDFDLEDVASDVEVDPAELDVPSDEDEDAGFVIILSCRISF
jgi:hypothetical protein